MEKKSTRNGETIKVMARVRPIVDREIRSGCTEAIQVKGNMIKVAGKRAFTSQSNRSCHRFDKVFGTQSEQNEIFKSTQPLIDAALEGYNSTIFAYGQTGTGKTHTMLGVDIWRLGQEHDSAARAVNSVMRDEKLWGIIPRAMQYVFGKLEASKRTTISRVMCSYLEIYNEHVYDLLQYEQSKMLKSGLEIREDKRRGVFVQDATEVSVSTEEEVLSMLWKGAKNRAMVATDMNAHSSRSHTIFRVVIERKPLNKSADGETKIIRSKINLVDLAGSEKWKPHQLNKFSETRVKEMTSINQSLSNLGNCVRALLERRRQHIPYRNSKLTRLLQDSLGGNTKTAFIVTLSPSSDALEESQSTLQFADRAKKVVVHAMVNETLDDASILRKYEHQIARLKAMLKKSVLQQQAPSQSAHAMDTKELEELRSENISLMKQLQQTKKELHHTMEENRALRRALRSSDDGDNDGGVAKERASLEARSRTLEKKMKGIHETENQQREQKEWLRKYHQWLRSLPVQETKTDDGETRATLDLKGRLNLLEWSVLMQSEELQRTKRAFLQELQPLQEELHQKSVLLERFEEREADLRDQLAAGPRRSAVAAGGASISKKSNVRNGPAIASYDRTRSADAAIPAATTTSEDDYVATRRVPSSLLSYPSRTAKDAEKRGTSTKRVSSSVSEMKSEKVFEKLAVLREQMHREQISTHGGRNKFNAVGRGSATQKGSEGKTVSGDSKENKIRERSPLMAKQQRNIETPRSAAVDEIQWIQYFDPNTKRHYYYNESLQKTQWEKPARFIPGTPM